MINPDYFRKSNSLVNERLKKGLRQIDGKPLTECSCDKPSPYLIAKALQKRSELFEWGGIDFTEDELIEYREEYNALIATHKPVNCLTPDAIAQLMNFEQDRLAIMNNGASLDPLREADYNGSVGSFTFCARRGDAPCN